MASEMGPRRKFHLLGLVAMPAGWFGIGLLAMWTTPWLMIAGFAWVLYMVKVTNAICCPHCNHKLYLGKIVLGPLRFRACVSHVGPNCERCGRVIDDPRSAPAA